MIDGLNLRSFPYWYWLFAPSIFILMVIWLLLLIIWKNRPNYLGGKWVPAVSRSVIGRHVRHRSAPSSFYATNRTANRVDTD